MEWQSIVNLVLNVLLGGGFLVTLITLKSTRKKSAAEAKSSELDNVEDAVKIWRETAEQLKTELLAYKDNQSEMSAQIEKLRNEVMRLTVINNEIVILLTKITPDNLDQMIEQIKKIHCQ